MINSTFDPENYTISVKKVTEDGDTFYMATVLEIPDLREYADTSDFARDLMLDSITTAFEMCMENGTKFPEPSSNIEQPNVSGRVTLRLSKTLHYNCITHAQSDGVSLNTFISNCLSAHIEKQISDQTMLSNIQAALVNAMHFFAPSCNTRLRTRDVEDAHWQQGSIMSTAKFGTQYAFGGSNFDNDSLITNARVDRLPIWQQS
ncbi:TPA: toxin-antitoxin system HicB family antitoxin [Morganella morganii]|nr:toxin-antitoxin system HicB family antitoxin [Morganella morganii]